MEIPLYSKLFESYLNIFSLLNFHYRLNHIITELAMLSTLSKKMQFPVNIEYVGISFTNEIILMCL